MGLFNKNSKQLPELFTEDELADEAGVNYNTVLDWLTGLTDDDYTKVCNIAAIYRKANQDAAAALGIPNEPTSFILQPELPADSVQDPATAEARAETILDEDDDADIAAFLDEPEFLEDEPKTTKSKQIDVSEK